MEFAISSVDSHRYGPKVLSLSKGLPGCKQGEKEPQAPPFCSPVSIPFRWEEAPGRPRLTLKEPTNGKAAVPLRRLELPPGFIPNGAKFTIIPTSSTRGVVEGEGPHVIGRTLSLARSFNSRKGKDYGSGKMAVGGSARWVRSLEAEEEGMFRVDIAYDPPLSTATPCPPLSSSARKRKKPSFLRLSTAAANLWGEIYGSFKLAVAVPWRRAYGN